MSVDFKTFLETLLPAGSAWLAKSAGSLEGLIDGLGDSVSDVRDHLVKFARIRDPEQTPILSDLEHEYGVVPNPGLTEAERRELLNGVVYAKPDFGVDYLQSKLDAAGFTELTVYQNEGPEDPDFYVTGRYACVCGNTVAYCGSSEAYCGYRSGGGYLLINDNDDDSLKSVPATDDTWHLVFFIGGDKSSPSVGWFLVVDGDMEETGVSDWTAGNNASLSKDTIEYTEGAQSMEVAPGDATVDADEYFADQDVGPDTLDKGCTLAHRMQDNGDNVLYDTAFEWTDKTRKNGENGDLSNTLGLGVLQPGTNNSTKVALDFNGSDEMAWGIQEVESDGHMSTWFNVSDSSRDPWFDLAPEEAGGYKDLPTDLTINGTTVGATFVYRGEDADATSWDAYIGDDLPIAGTGADPTVDEQAPGIGGSRVGFKGGRYYQAASSAFADVSTDDFVVEAVVKIEDESALILSKYASGSAQFELVTDATNNAIQVILNGTVFQYANIVGEWVHFIGFGDRSGSLVGYVNGVPGTPTSISALSASSLGDGNALTLGARTSGINPTSSSVSYCAMWHSPAWLDTHLQAGLAKERFARVCGVYPEIAQDIDVIADGDMEASGTSAWTVENSGVLTKETTDPHSGSQNLRVTYAAPGSAAFQSILSVGGVYQVSGWFRGDGTRAPQVQQHTTVIRGTSSTTWQYFDEVITTLVSSKLFFNMVSTGAGYVEFDGVTVTGSGAIPKALSRSTMAYLEKVPSTDDQTYLIPVGANWMRTDRFFNADASEIEQGYRVEGAVTNQFLYSEDLTDATWTKTACAITGDASTGVGEQAFDAIVSDGTDVFHKVSQSITVSTGLNTISVYVQAGDKDIIKVDNTSETNAHCYFDLTNLTTSAGAGASEPRIEVKGNGDFRIAFSYTATGTTAAFEAGPVAAFGTDNFTGDSVTEDAYFFGFQHESGNPFPRSYVKTEAATASKTADQLQFWAAENVGGQDPSVVETRVRCYASETSTSVVSALADMNDSTNSNRHVALSNGVNTLEANTLTAGASVSSITASGSAVYTGGNVTSESSLKTDDFRLYYSRGSVGTPDTSGATPTGLVDLDIGMDYTSSAHFNGLIQRITISPYGLTNPRGIFCSQGAAGPKALIAYDEVDPVTGEFEILATSNLSGVTTLNGGSLYPNTWNHVALLWAKSGSSNEENLYIDGVEVDSSTSTFSDPAELNTIISYGVGAVINGLSPYLCFGAVSISDPKLFNEYPGTADELAWLEAEYNKGVYEEIDGLVSAITGRMTDGTLIHGKFVDVVGGLDLETDTSTFDDVKVRVSTEAGMAIRFSGSTDMINALEYSDHPFFTEDDHSFECWAKIGGSVDQTIFSNNGTTGYYQSLVYDVSSGELVFTSAINGSDETVSAAIELNRLYHVMVTRDYDSGAGNTTIRIYIDGALEGSRVVTGAPSTSASYDDLTIGHDGSGGDQLTGSLQGIRFYDAAVSSAGVSTRYTEGQTRIENGPYATQTITPTSLPTTVSGYGFIEQSGVAYDKEYEYGYPVVLYRRTSGDPLRALFVGGCNSDRDATTGWENDWIAFSESVESVYEIRLVAKNTAYTRIFGDSGTVGAVNFDDISGGDDPGDSQIAFVDVPADKRQALENIIMRSKPLHTWAAMVVRYV